MNKLLPEAQWGNVHRTILKVSQEVVGQWNLY